MSVKLLQLIMGGDASGYVSSVKEATAVTNTLSSSIQNLGSRISMMGASFAKIGAGISGAISLPLSYMSQRAVRTSVAVAEMQNVFNVAFSDIQTEAQKTAQILSNAFDLDMSSTMRGLSSVADMLIGFGMSQKEALNASAQIMQMGGDLASFYNFEGGATGASEVILEAVMGQTRQLKQRLGVDVGERRISGRIGELSDSGIDPQQARLQAILEQIPVQAVNAMGDYARTSDSLANRIRALGEVTKGLYIAFGDVLIEGLNLEKFFSRLVTFLSGITEKLKELPQGAASVISKIVLGLVAVGPALGALGTVMLTLGALIKFIGGIFIIKILAVAGLVVGVVYAVITAIMNLIDASYSSASAFDKVYSLIENIGIPVFFGLYKIMGFVVMIVEGAIAAIRSMIYWISGFAQILWDVIKNPWDIGKIPERVKDLGSTIVQEFTDTVLEGTGLSMLLDVKYSDVKSGVLGVLDTVKDMFNKEKEAAPDFDFATTPGAGKGGAEFTRALTAGVQFGTREAYSSIARHFSQTNTTEKDIERNTRKTANQTERMVEELRNMNEDDSFVYDF